VCRLLLVQNENICSLLALLCVCVYVKMYLYVCMSESTFFLSRTKLFAAYRRCCVSVSVSVCLCCCRYVYIYLVQIFGVFVACKRCCEYVFMCFFCRNIFNEVCGYGRVYSLKSCCLCVCVCMCHSARCVCVCMYV
jgi:hypothetical protein